MSALPWTITELDPASSAFHTRAKNGSIAVDSHSPGKTRFSAADLDDAVRLALKGLIQKSAA
jgi:hypothetical protein